MFCRHVIVDNLFIWVSYFEKKNEYSLGDLTGEWYLSIIMQCYFAFHFDPHLLCKSTLQGDNEDKQCADPI